MRVVRPDHIRKDALALCEIGNRVVGEPGEIEARQYILKRFADVGLTNLREEPFQVATYRPLEARCQLVGTSSLDDLTCVGLQFTDTGTVETEAVHLGGLGEGADLARVIERVGGISGRIAVLDTSYPYLFAEMLVALGAVGIVVTSDAPDGFTCHLNALMYPALAGRPNGTRLPVPGVTVEHEAARRLLDHISNGGRHVRITHAADYELVMTANIVGELEGEESAERAVVGGHYDSQIDGVGASDNASGIASLIEAARVMAEGHRYRTLVVAAFADEEGGFRGASQYCRQHARTIGQTVGMINIDAPGWSPSKRSLHADPAMRSFALECAAAAGWVPEEQMDASAFPGSDHNPFIDAGVPACFFWRNPPRHPYYHTAGDTPEILDFAVVAETAEVARVTAERLVTNRGLDLGRARPSRRWLDLRPETVLAATPLD